MRYKMSEDSIGNWDAIIHKNVNPKTAEMLVMWMP